MHLKRVATLPCEMFVLKQRRVPELNEAARARLSHSKQLLENIHPEMLASFCSRSKRHMKIEVVGVMDIEERRNRQDIIEVFVMYRGYISVAL